LLGKLIKYEFKATAKIILLFWLGLVVVSVINFFVMPWTDAGSSLGASLAFGDTLNTVKGIMQGLVFVMYILISIAVIVVSLVIVVMRFYKMLGDEGYLYFTLPVTASQHIFSKLIVAAIWNICSTLLVGLSVLIVIGRHDVFAKIPEFWRYAVNAGTHPGVWLLCIAITIVVVTVTSIIEFYTAISIGPHITRSRIGGSIIAYIIIYVATQIIGIIGSLIMLLAMQAQTEEVIFSTGSVSSAIETANSVALGYFILMVVMDLVIAIPCYFIMRHMLNKKLNLG
jgi:hypothetical protein